MACLFVWGMIMNLNEIATSLEQFPTVLRALLAGQSAEMLQRCPAEGEWSVNEVIGHLIEADRDAFMGRVVGIVAGDGEIAPVSPTAPVAEKGYRVWEFEVLMAAFEAQRVISAEFIRSLDPDTLSKTASYAKYGTFTAADFVAEWPYHDLVHLKQIADNLQTQYIPPMSTTMRTALGVS